MARAPSVIMTAADKKTQAKEIRAQIKTNNFTIKANEKINAGLDKANAKLIAQLEKLDPPAPTRPADAFAGVPA